jgi:glycosyltransferase involved in cell wall biosynthesis
VKVTAILCTYNRSRPLAKALDSLAASVFPEPDSWEVLVVDNNSTDQTRTVVERFVDEYPERFRYVFEARQGKSYALNTGIREAHGEIVAFVDDDVTVESNWLYNLTSDLSSGEWVGAGGRILIPPGFSPPGWLALEGPWRQGAALCAHFDLGDLPGELKEAPYGTNMAFRRQMFHRYGEFRTDLGPRPGSELRNEDTEFGNRVLAGGERLRYVPSAVVYHPVPEGRVRKSFFRARWFTVGRAEVREKGPRIRFSQMPSYYISVLRDLRNQIRECLHARDPKERFSRECIAWHTVGTMAEIWSQSLRGKVTRTSYSNSRNSTSS